MNSQHRWILLRVFTWLTHGALACTSFTLAVSWFFCSFGSPWPVSQRVHFFLGGPFFFSLFGSLGRGLAWSSSWDPLSRGTRSRFWPLPVTACLFPGPNYSPGRRYGFTDMSDPLSHWRITSTVSTGSLFAHSTWSRSPMYNPRDWYLRPLFILMAKRFSLTKSFAS